MKILWIVNMLMPELAEHLGATTGSSGTWMIDISKMLATTPDIELGIACVYGSEFCQIKHNNIDYFLLPGTGKNMLFYTKKYESIWRKINQDFQPDIVHLHGTEYSHGLAFLRTCSEIPAVVSIQGILNRIKDVDFGEVPLKEFIWNRTLKQNLRLNGEIEMHLLHCKNAKYETEIIQSVQYVNGVNAWDISLAKSINSKLKSFQLEYNLREEFYDAPSWDIDTVKRHTIFTNPGGTPLKGLHQLIRACALLKDKYPNIKIKVPGMGENGMLQRNSAYAKYIDKLICQLGMQGHVEFLGRQTGAEMMEQMRSAHTVVVPSAIEGTSLVLREAMYLGCPVIASFRGGMADFISDKEDGFLFDFQEYPYLADRIDRLFSNDHLCLKFSDAARNKAIVAHDRERNSTAYLSMYQEILDS